MASKGSRTISLILALVMVLGLFPSMSPSASAELQEFDPASVFYGAPTIIPYGVPTDDAVNGQASVASGIPTTGLVDGQADAPVLTELVPQHVHHFVYSAEGNTIVARCDAEDCPLENGEAKLILKTDDAAKTDSVYAGASIQNDIPLPESAVLGPVVYYVLNEAELAETGAKPESFLTEENRLEIAPKRVGTYLAAVTLTVDGTDYTVWNIFEIYLPKAVFTVRPEPVEGLVYDGQPHALVTPGDAGGSTVLYAVLANDETEPTDGFDDTFPMAADAGLYVVWFRAAGDADHEDSDTDHVVVRIQKASQAAPAAPEAEVITAESITLKASEGYEYSMDGENWQSDNTFGGLTANTEYRFFQRITGDYNLEPSPAGEAAVFCTLEDAPVVEEEPEAVPVKLWLVCDPPETLLTVRSSAEGSSPVSPEEDGSYLLLPGSWICSAAAEGYQPIENSELTISAENGDTQYMTLELQKLPPVISPAFEETAFVSGMAVRVSAPEGVFPEGSTLSVTPVPVQEQQFVDAAVGSERGGSKTVMVSYTFDIKVLGPDGNEVQPADAQKVKVSFTANAVAEQNLNTDVYHVSGEGASLSAERLDTVEDGTTVTAETSGFSYYTVEFTYDTLQYVLPGGQDVALSEILNTVGLSGEVTGVTCSRPDLFSADTRSGEWVVYSHQPFTSTEWMKVVINGLEYTIIVTDDSLTTVGEKGDFYVWANDVGAELDKIVLNRAAPIGSALDGIGKAEVANLQFYYNDPAPEDRRIKFVIAENTCREITARFRGQTKNFLEIQLSEGDSTGSGTLKLQAQTYDGVVVGEKVIPVEVINNPVPTLGITPNPVVLDLAKSKQSVLHYTYNLAEDEYISYVRFEPYRWYTGFITFGANKEITANSAQPVGNYTLAAFQVKKKGRTDPVAWEVVDISVINSNDASIKVYEKSKEINEIVIDTTNSLSTDLTFSCNINLTHPRWEWVEEPGFENYYNLYWIICNPETGDTHFTYHNNLAELNSKNNWGLKPNWNLKIRLYEADTLVAERSIPVKIIDPINAAVDEAVNVADAAAKAVADAATDETVKAADPANKATKETSGSGGGSNSVTPGKTTAPLTPEQKKKKQSDDFDSNNRAYLDRAKGVGVDPQVYKLTYNETTRKYCYNIGWCTTNCYVTLYNRYIAKLDDNVTKATIDFEDMLDKIIKVKHGALQWIDKDASKANGTKGIVLASEGDKRDKAYFIKGGTGQTSKYKYNYNGHTITVYREYKAKSGEKIGDTPKNSKNKPIPSATVGFKVLTAEKLAQYLREHPTGILLQAISPAEHAVCVVDYSYYYDEKNKEDVYTFKVADPCGEAGVRKADKTRNTEPYDVEIRGQDGVIMKTWKAGSTSNAKLSNISWIAYLQG